MKTFSLKKLWIIAIIPFVFGSCKSVKYATQTHENSGYGISVDDSKALFTNFNSNRSPDETEYVWISLKDLKNYINFLDEVAAKNNKAISGIAIVYGKYDANKTVTNDKARAVPRFGDYKNRETVFFNPTFRDASVSQGQEILYHKPFSISPYNAQIDKYVGNYTAIQYDKRIQIGYNLNLLHNIGGISSAANTKTNVAAGENTSLNLNELQAIPPKL